MKRTGIAIAFTAIGVAVVACNAIIGTRDLSLGGDGGPGSGTDSGIATGQDGGSKTDSGGNNVDGSTCGDIKTDPKNCGACGFDCSNGSCNNGLCTLIDNGFYAPLGIAVDSNNVYFTEIGGQTGGILSCAKNGCEAAGATRLTSTDPAKFYAAPAGLILQSGFLYYANNYNTTDSPVSQAGLYRLQPDGGTLGRLQQNDANAIWVASGNGMLAWTTNETDAGVHTCASPDCSTAAVVGNGAQSPDTVAVTADGRIVYGTSGAGGVATTSGVFMCTDAACTGGPKLVTHTSDFVTSVFVDATNVYFSTLTTVSSCPLAANCAAPTPIATAQVNVQTVIVSGSTIYWAVGGTANQDPTNDGAIRKCTTTGCTAPIDIAIAQQSPAGLALDADAIYWTNFGELASASDLGQVMKAPR